MDFDTVATRIAGIPFTKPERGRRLYDFVLQNEIEDVLELGCHHGVSTLYLAAALHERGQGKVVSLDRKKILDLSPNVMELASELGLSGHVKLMLRDETLHLSLQDMLEQQFERNTGIAPCFDFAFLDAGHDWVSTGYGFLLVEKLLRPGGWVLFDDYRWLPLEARNSGATPPVRRVIDLLVRTHPAISLILEDGSWCWARKVPSVR